MITSMPQRLLSVISANDRIRLFVEIDSKSLYLLSKIFSRRIFRHEKSNDHCTFSGYTGAESST